jgi:hypothetical protein
MTRADLVSEFLGHLGENESWSKGRAEIGAFLARPQPLNTEASLHQLPLASALIDQFTMVITLCGKCKSI